MKPRRNQRQKEARAPNQRRLPFADPTFYQGRLTTPPTSRTETAKPPSGSVSSMPFRTLQKPPNLALTPTLPRLEDLTLDIYWTRDDHAFDADAPSTMFNIHPRSLELSALPCLAEWAPPRVACSSSSPPETGVDIVLWGRL